MTCVLALGACGLLSAQDIAWPEMSVEAKPGARWWWMGSAVDKANLTRSLEEYAAAGMGTMEITPIYGVKGNEARDISFLSPQWMEMLGHAESEAARLGMQMDMNTGTGWPFGGPEVTIEDAACRLLIEEYQLKKGERLKQKVETTDSKQKPYAELERLMAFSEDGKCLDLTDKVHEGRLDWKAPKGNWRLIAAFCGKTFQKVKRAAPGGEGYVMNHFSHEAVERYVGRLVDWFCSEEAPVITRQTCCAYCASFICRASFVSIDIIRSVLYFSLTWINKYIDMLPSMREVMYRYDAQDNPLNPGDTGHLVFYSIMQAVCYILCFTSKRFEQEKNGVQFLRSWDWTRILNSPLDPLRVFLDRRDEL